MDLDKDKGDGESLTGLTLAESPEQLGVGVGAPEPWHQYSRVAARYQAPGAPSTGFAPASRERRVASATARSSER